MKRWISFSKTPERHITVERESGHVQGNYRAIQTVTWRLTSICILTTGMSIKRNIWANKMCKSQRYNPDRRYQHSWENSIEMTNRDIFTFRRLKTNVFNHWSVTSLMSCTQVFAGATAYPCTCFVFMLAPILHLFLYSKSCSVPSYVGIFVICVQINCRNT